jgi:FixJ family two-component response regulator
MIPTILIYVLDDDHDILEDIRIAFNVAGIKDYRLFTNVEEFLESFNADVHIAVVDYYLGDLTAPKIMKQIRQKNPWCLVTMISGVENPKAITAFLNSGGNKFLYKGEPNFDLLLTEYVTEQIQQTRDRILFFDRLSKPSTMTYEQDT